MSFFARLMGSDPDSRIKKARKFLDRRDFGEARFELLELDHPDATALMKQALEGLILLNLSEAEARSQMGDVDGASEHMELARASGRAPTRSEPSESPCARPARQRDVRRCPSPRSMSIPREATRSGVSSPTTPDCASR